MFINLFPEHDSEDMSEQFCARKQIPSYLESSLLVISGDGPVTEHEGGSLGLYAYDPVHSCYKQVTTEENAAPRYLYQEVNNQQWMVGPVPGKSDGWLLNRMKSETVPSSGWLWGDGKSWHDDPSIRVTPGKLPSLCDTIIITGKGEVTNKQPKSLGTFSKTEKWFNGKPVWINSESGYYLNSDNDSRWSVGSKIGNYGIKSSSTPINPADAHTWEYWTGSDDKPANIIITCS